MIASGSACPDHRRRVSGMTMRVRSSENTLIDSQWELIDSQRTMMSEPTRAEIARKKRSAARQTLANAVKEFPGQLTLEPTVADFDLPLDFDCDEFEYFRKNREKTHSRIQIFVFAIFVISIFLFIKSKQGYEGFFVNFVIPIAASYFLIYVLPIADLGLEKAFGDGLYVENALRYRNALRNWEYFQTTAGVGFWQNLRGVDLESATAKLFRDRGWKVSSTRTTGDGGIDLILTYDYTSFYCQCKGHAKPVSVATVREIAGVCTASNGIPMLIVVNGVTGPASKAAHELSVLVWDSTQLAAFARGDLRLNSP